MKKNISLFLLLYLLWLLISGFEMGEWILGGIVALILTGILRNRVSLSLGRKSVGRAIVFLFIYIPVLIADLIKANFDVARRILDPALPLNPGFVKIPTEVGSDLGKLTLANSITLTPGTLSMDADDDHIYIHWIDVKGDSPKSHQDYVSSDFEKILRRVFND